jgi:uncharacterized protein (TIGR01777 family)
MRVTVTGASGLVGPAVTSELLGRGAEVTVLSRDPRRARAALGEQVETIGWSTLTEPAPAAALAGRDAVVHLAGAPVAQRWSARAKQAIHQSRVLGTRNLVTGIAAARPRPRALICSSAVGIYGARHEEPLDEDARPGGGFLAQTCVAWEQEARQAAQLGARVACMRTGMALDAGGGALAKMLPPFRVGVGGPVAGGGQYVSWIHLADLAAMYATAVQDEAWSGPVNATAPEPVTNREFSTALGRALHRPASLPVPGVALRLLYGEMAEIVTTGQRVLPAKALVLGYEFRYPHLPEALASALA